MSDCFDNIDKAAVNWARGSETKVYETLLLGLKYKDPAMAIAFLKFINQMIYIAEEESKKAKFIAKLETQGIFQQL